MYFLRFNSKDHFEEVFEQFMLHDTNSKTVPAYIGTAAVDVVGVIWKPTGKAIDTYTPTSVVFEPLDGWHVNISEYIAELDEYMVVPTNPVRVFAGA